MKYGLSHLIARAKRQKMWVSSYIEAHIWDPDISLVEAYRTLFRQFAMLFKIAAKNRARGKRPMPVLELLRLYRRQQRLMAAYPLSH